MTAKKTATRFPEFWKLYPRKDSKVYAQSRWKYLKCDAEANDIIRAVVAMSKLGGCLHGDPAQSNKKLRYKYTLHASTFLNRRVWEDLADDDEDPEPDPSQLNGASPWITPTDWLKAHGNRPVLGKAAWERVRAGLKATMDPESFAAWIAPLRLVGMDNGELCLETDTPFQAGMVSREFRESIHEEFGALSVRLVLAVAEIKEKEE